MGLTTAEQIYERIVKPLPTNERLRLVEMIVHNLTAQPAKAGPPKRHWREIRGMVAYPMCGEDAQEWVSRTRREADAHREKQLRHEP